MVKVSYRNRQDEGQGVSARQPEALTGTEELETLQRTRKPGLSLPGFWCFCIFQSLKVKLIRIMIKKEPRALPQLTGKPGAYGLPLSERPRLWTVGAKAGREAFPSGSGWKEPPAASPARARGGPTRTGPEVSEPRQGPADQKRNSWSNSSKTVPPLTPDHSGSQTEC